MGWDGRMRGRRFGPGYRDGEVRRFWWRKEPEQWVYLGDCIGDFKVIRLGYSFVGRLGLS